MLAETNQINETGTEENGKPLEVVISQDGKMQTKDGHSVFTLAEIANRYNVSLKTISRWRKRKMFTVRKLINSNSSKKCRLLGITDTELKIFERDHRDVIKIGINFEIRSDDKIDKIQDKIRIRFMKGYLSVETVSKTINKVLENGDDTKKQMERERAIEENRLFTLYMQGENISVITSDPRCNIPRNKVREIIRRKLNELVKDIDIKFIPNEEFSKIGSHKKREAEVLGPMPKDSLKKTKPPKGIRNSYLESLYDVALLTKEQEVHLFRQMNYLKYIASELLASVEDDDLCVKGMNCKRKALHINAMMQEVRNIIIQRNLRLVVSIAKRYVGNGSQLLFELISDGNMSLMRAVNNFDFARGNKFSTYATYAIMKNFARSIPKNNEHNKRFKLTDYEAKGIETLENHRTDECELLSKQETREAQILQATETLDKREQIIIRKHFGLGKTRGKNGNLIQNKSISFKEIGHEIGISKERVRQIETRALAKLRRVLQKQDIDEAI